MFSPNYAEAWKKCNQNRFQDTMNYFYFFPFVFVCFRYISPLYRGAFSGLYGFLWAMYISNQRGEYLKEKSGEQEQIIGSKLRNTGNSSQFQWTKKKKKLCYISRHVYAERSEAEGWAGVSVIGIDHSFAVTRSTYGSCPKVTISKGIFFLKMYENTNLNLFVKNNFIFLTSHYSTL